MLAINNIEDAVLLAHYIDKVFHWQFRFCAQLPWFNQGHILWLTSKSQSLYHATLALSHTHRNLQRNSRGSPANSEHKARYELAIKHLQHDLQDPKSCDDVCILGCIIMFLHITLLYDPNEIDWPVHLQAGTSIITSWVGQNFGSLAYQINRGQEDNKNAIESTRVCLVTSIIRFDILSSLTRDSAPGLNRYYRRFLKSSSCGICPETVLGCRTWVFSTLLDVYALRDWKKTTKAAGLLSLWELTSRAAVIRESLETDILLNLEQMDKMKQEMGSDKNKDALSQRSEYDILVVTHIYACSVSVLLETIVSGGHPQLPEIKKRVDRVLQSYEYVSDLELLHALLWPLCVVGCVAQPEHHGTLRCLLSTPEVAHIGVFRGSLELLEKCWEKTACTGSVDDGFDFTQARKYMSWDILIA
ncbi:fungal-specific transcription factor domain-containing protein [Xylogone sp. PMI_703]|nr:fungal-specific transcription factor domain-containing protein [Xylogone sp. PMI_703]